MILNRPSKSELWIRGKPFVSHYGRISLSVGSCRISSEMPVYCHFFCIPQVSLLNEREQVFMALQKNVPKVGNHSGWDKTHYLLLSYLSHLACFQRGPWQAGSCFMCLIDTWARGLPQMLVSLCTSTNKTIRHSLSLQETNREAGRCCWRAVGIAC